MSYYTTWGLDPNMTYRVTVQTREGVECLELLPMDFDWLGRVKVLDIVPLAVPL